VGIDSVGIAICGDRLRNGWSNGLEVIPFLEKLIQVGNNVSREVLFYNVSKGIKVRGIVGTEVAILQLGIFHTVELDH